jgi:2-methylcitrate dehydratase PrpD
MDIAAFIHRTSWETLPEQARHAARRCLLDTLGAGIGGRQTGLSQIVHGFVAAAFGGGDAPLWLDGRRVSAPGAALAAGMTVDALDIHDGYRLTKGHAGAALIPAALATVGLGPQPVAGHELLATLVVGYEVACRAGIALHATACDYHSSGAWNTLGCAAMTARRLQLSAEATRHALGIAEYYGPRSQMMRCIDHPTMLKDGSGWGALAGVSAGLLAAAGFTGAPAISLEGADVAATWADLGQHWLIAGQYYKPYAVCYWAQAPIAAALSLRDSQAIAVEQIAQIRVHTFHEATRLTGRRPADTEQAQYSLPFALAAALVHGQLGASELSGPALHDTRVLMLAERVELVEDAAFNARFPAERLCRLAITTASGACYQSGETRPRWDTSDPPSDDALREKFRWLASFLPHSRAAALETAAWHCAELPDARELSRLLANPARE